MNTFRQWIAPLALLALLGPAQAQILVGQTAGFTGTAAAGVKETADGARLWIDAVNAKGGVNGQKIELLSLDDGFEPKRAAENARKLIEDNQVVALFLNRGTPHTEAILPLLERHGVALIAPSTGAMVLHQPVNKWVFNVRATYQREAERAVQHLSLIGMDQIGVIHVEDSFGADLLEGARKGFTAVAKNPVFVEKYDRAKWDFTKIAPLVASSGVQAVLFIGSGNAVADGIEAIRMTPVGDSRMYNRDGFLTHTYLLRRRGDSSGCVVFEDYNRFLNAFKRGNVKTLVVVPSMRELPKYMAML